MHSLGKSMGKPLIVKYIEETYNKEKIITSIDDISLLQDKLKDEQKEFKAICSLIREFRNLKKYNKI